jgi:hypothetical protein
MSNSLTLASTGAQAVASTAAGGALVYGAAAVFRSAYVLAIQPADVEPWLMLLAHMTLAGFNGAILIYHLIGKARRDEYRAWFEVKHPPRHRAKPPETDQE